MKFISLILLFAFSIAVINASPQLDSPATNDEYTEPRKNRVSRMMNSVFRRKSQKDEIEKPKSISMFVSKRGNVNAADSAGNTPLHDAAKHDHNNNAQSLIERGAFIDAHNNEGLTPLHSAVIYNAPRVAQTLIKAGADISAVDNKGFTPLVLAKKGEYSSEIIKMLEKSSKSPADTVV